MKNRLHDVGPLASTLASIVEIAIKNVLEIALYPVNVFFIVP